MGSADGRKGETKARSTYAKAGFQWEDLWKAHPEERPYQEAEKLG